MPQRNQYTPEMIVRLVKYKIIHATGTTWQAQEIVRAIAEIDWDEARKEILNGPNGRSCDRICILCGKIFVATNYRERTSLCKNCKTPELTKEASIVLKHCQRTERLGLPSTLTLKEWIKSLEFFEWKCAYCGGNYQTLDHILPISRLGGTERGNCIPACKKCNFSKSSDEIKWKDRPHGYIVPQPALDKIISYIQLSS